MAPAVPPDWTAPASVPLPTGCVVLAGLAAAWPLLSCAHAGADIATRQVDSSHSDFGIIFSHELFSYLLP